MNEQEMKRRLCCLEADCKNLNTEIGLLKAELAEAEKPKLQCGNFGISERGAFVISQNTTDKELEPFYEDRRSDGSVYARKNPNEYTVFGNIFKLTENWGKPFEGWEKDKYATGIQIVNDEINLYACTTMGCSKKECYCALSIERAEQFWHAFGHALMELKRKENK